MEKSIDFSTCLSMMMMMMSFGQDTRIPLIHWPIRCLWLFCCCSIHPTIDCPIISMLSLFSSYFQLDLIAKIKDNASYFILFLLYSIDMNHSKKKETVINYFFFPFFPFNSFVFSIMECNAMFITFRFLLILAIL